VILPDGGGQPMQWVFVEDIARACVRALAVAEAVGEAFNVAHTEPTSQRSFVEALARVAGAEPRFVSVPRALIAKEGGQLLGERLYFGEYLDLPPLTSIVDKAARVLGITPTPLDAALRESYAWYRTQPRRAVDYAFEDRLMARV
jgi:nucleoside-diphosphate-sugar epimerase